MLYYIKVHAHYMPTKFEVNQPNIWEKYGEGAGALWTPPSPVLRKQKKAVIEHVDGPIITHTLHSFHIYT